MSEAIEYSQRLGAISVEQFEAIAQTLNLGQFLSAEAITQGLFGQNVFLNTSEGRSVLRGAPHWVRGEGETTWRREDRWQFNKELYFAKALHEHTSAPVPWPMLMDASCRIFDWPCLVMPRMPGHCFDDASLHVSTAHEDRLGIARALGENLAEMQRLRHPFAGDFDIDTISLTPHPRGFTAYLIDSTLRFMRDAVENGRLDAVDTKFIDTIIKQASEGFEPAITYPHFDYKLGNLTVDHDQSGLWHVTGLFDFHEASFGDGLLDVVRQFCGFFDHDPGLARAFASTYFAARPPGDASQPRLCLYALNDRLKIWEYWTRPELHSPFKPGTTFRRWAERYLAALDQAFESY